jgi:hypothetical protein
LSADGNENKPGGKGHKRKSRQPGKKMDRGRKAGQPPVTPPDRLQTQHAARAAIAAASVTGERVTNERVSPEQIVQDPIGTAANARVTAAESSTQSHSPDEAPAGVATRTASMSVQAVANAYGDYSWKSLDQARTFFEQLAGVRSIDRAFQLQSDFAREAYDTFVAESRRIRELQGALARQRLGHLEEFVARMTRLPR